MPSNQEKFEQIQETTKRIQSRMNDSDSAANEQTDTSGGEGTPTEGAAEAGQLTPGTKEYREKAQELTRRVKALQENRNVEDVDEIGEIGGELNAQDIINASQEGGVDVSQMEVPDEEPMTEYDSLFSEIEADIRSSMDDIPGGQALMQQVQSLQEEGASVQDSMQEAMGDSYQEGQSPYANLMRMARTGGPEYDREAELEEERAEQGIGERQERIERQNMKVAELQGQYEQLKAEERNEIQAIRQSKAPLESIQAEVNNKKLEYQRRKANLSAKLSAEAAVLQAQQDNLNTARQLVNESVEASMFDYEQELSRWNQFLSVNSSVIQSLDKKKQNLLQGYREGLREESQIKREELQTKMNLQLSAIENGVSLGLSSSEIRETDLDNMISVYEDKMEQKRIEEETEGSSFASFPAGIKVDAKRIINDSETIDEAYSKVDSWAEEGRITSTQRSQLLGAVDAGWEEMKGVVTIKDEEGNIVNANDIDQYKMLEKVANRYGDNPDDFSFNFSEELIITRNIDSLPLEQRLPDSDTTYGTILTDMADMTLQNKEKISSAEMQKISELYRANGYTKDDIAKRVKIKASSDRKKHLCNLSMQWGDKALARENCPNPDEAVGAIESTSYRESREDLLEDPLRSEKAMNFPFLSIPLLLGEKTMQFGETGLKGFRETWNQLWE